MPAVATVEDVSKLYGRFAALRHVSTTLERGRCYLLLGENGAGKSTLLRVLAGLLRPTLGRVRRARTPPAEARARIGYMSHAAMLYDELTAREPGVLGAALSRSRRASRRTRRWAWLGLTRR